MFPSSYADKRAHKRAAARISKQKQEFARRAGLLKSPEQLVQFILAEGAMQYRRGARQIALSFEVPVANFVEWAVNTGLIAKDEDDIYVKQLVRRPLTKLAREQLKQEIEPCILKNFDCKTDGGVNFVFEVQFSVLKPR